MFCGTDVLRDQHAAQQEGKYWFTPFSNYPHHPRERNMQSVWKYPRQCLLTESLWRKLLRFYEMKGFPSGNSRDPECSVVQQLSCMAVLTLKSRNTGSQ